MRYKDGVSLGAGIHPGLAWALDVIDAYWRAAFGVQATVTALADGVHSENSRHYGIAGDTRTRAADLRTRDLDGAEKARLRNDLRKLLGAGFDVILETTHLHVEVEMGAIARVVQESA